MEHNDNILNHLIDVQFELPNPFQDEDEDQIMAVDFEEAVEVFEDPESPQMGVIHFPGIGNVEANLFFNFIENADEGFNPPKSQENEEK